MDRYSHTLRDQERAALDSLPKLSDKREDQREALRATGTDDAITCAPLARKAAFDGADRHRSAVDNRDSDVNNAFVNSPGSSAGESGGLLILRRDHTGHPQ